MSFYVYATSRTTGAAWDEYVTLRTRANECEDNDAAYAAADAAIVQWEKEHNYFQWRSLHQFVCFQCGTGQGEDQFGAADAQRFALKLHKTWALASGDDEVRYVDIQGFNVRITRADVEAMQRLADSEEGFYVA